MRCFPVFSLSLVLSCSPLLCPMLVAQAPDQLYTASRIQLDVTKVVIAQEKAWNNGDLDVYLSHFKDARDTEAVLNGPVRGLSNIRSAYHIAFAGKEAMGHLDQTEVQVRELGPAFALATGHYHLQRTKKNGGDAEGTFTEIFEKTAVGWELIFSETS